MSTKTEVPWTRRWGWLLTALGLVISLCVAIGALIYVSSATSDTGRGAKAAPTGCRGKVTPLTTDDQGRIVPALEVESTDTTSDWSDPTILAPLAIGLVGAGVGVSGQVLLWRERRENRRTPATDPAS
ncbi:hypothetical protein ACODT3_39610 [Streptomyces sp. 4.24]|uniref:hypothetical protein n=1 Tax=Streptomyces tritrimontium TaxID=3406573 RepID=UPI003BB4EC1F